MPATLLEYRLRIRNAADSADAVTAAAQLTTPIRGDGTEVFPIEGGSRTGVYSVTLADTITSGTSRILTSELTDASGNPQILSRRAYIDLRVNGGSWGVLVAGYVTRASLDDGITGVVEVGESNRLELTASAFARKITSGVPEPIRDYLARWPQRGCLLGGPVIGDWGPLKDTGGWEGTVAAVSGRNVTLTLTAAYLPPSWARTTNLQAAADFVNGAARPFLVPMWNPPDGNGLLDFLGPAFPQLVVQVAPLGGTARYGMPYPPVTPILGDVFNTNGALVTVGSNRQRGTLSLFLDSGETAPSVGAAVRVRVLTRDVHPVSPIYVTAHPCALYQTLRTEAGAPLDATSVTTATGTVGATRRVSARITAPQSLADFGRDAILGPHGLATRPGTSGQDEMVSTRIRDAATPADTLTDADLPAEDGARWFEQEEATVLTGVELRAARFLAADASVKPPPPDGILVQLERYERPFGDQTTFGRRTHVFDLRRDPEQAAVMLHVADSFTSDAESFTDAVAWEFAGRFARGAIAAEIPVLRGTTAFGVREGGELLVNCRATVNRQKRLGDDGTVPARAMQIVRRTIEPWGARLRLLDSGPAAQFTGSAPTLSVAQSAAQPRTVAQVTVTNAATLNAASTGVRLQLAVTTGGAPASTDYADVVAYGPGQIPTDPIALPAVTSGRTVYVRARSERANERPSAWTSGSTVTLDTLDAPTGLQAFADPVDGSRMPLQWTPGADAAGAWVDVYVRFHLDPAATAERRVALLPGSRRYVVEGLTPGTTYVFGVQHRDPTTGDVSALTTITAVSGAGALALEAPVDVVAFAGSADPVTGVPQASAEYGMAARVSAAPAALEVEVATEAAPFGAASREAARWMAPLTAAEAATYASASTFSAFAALGAAPAVPGQWTIVRGDAPSDGCTRLLRARTIRVGGTASAWSREVGVVPWTVRPLPGTPTEGLGIRARVVSTSATAITVRVAVADPFPWEAATLTIAEVGTGGVSPAGPVSLVNLTRDIDTTTTTDIVITRPAPGSGAGRVVFTASVPGRVAAVDAIDVPAQESQVTRIELVRIDYLLVTTAVVKFTINGADGSALSSTSGVSMVVQETARDGTVTESTFGVLWNSGGGYFEGVVGRVPGIGTAVTIRCTATTNRAVASLTVTIPTLEVQGTPQITSLAGSPDTATDDLELTWATVDLPTGTGLTLYIADESDTPTALTIDEVDVSGLTAYDYDTGYNVVLSGTLCRTRFTLEARYEGALLASRDVLVLWYR